MMETVTAVLSIVVIDLVLAGDNAIIIGMAAHRLPARQRRMAILLGTVGAVVLRVSFAAIAALLLTIPLLQATGGLLLIWIAIKLMGQETDCSESSHGEAKCLTDAIRIIILADAVMSLDNILAVAGASHGDIRLLAFGLALSIPIVMFGASLVASMLNKHRWLIYIGVGVLVWTSAKMVLGDGVVGSYLPKHLIMEIGLTGLIAGLVILANKMSNGRRRAAVEAGAADRKSASA